MPLLFQVLASGSKANAVLVHSPKTKILLDAGLSGRELARRLQRSPVGIDQLDAIILSHEHQDHVRGSGVVSRRCDLPVYLSQGTLENLPPQVGELAYRQVFQAGVCFSIGDLQIHPFAISHDAGEPAGFIIEHNGTRLGVCTDLGTATHLVRVRLQECHCLVLEANHDTEMLLNGPYPPHVKQRIRSRHGHLSNSDSCELLEDLFNEELQAVIFAHLSEVNNRPDLVLHAFRERCQNPRWQRVRIEIGKQHEVTPAIEIT